MNALNSILASFVLKSSLVSQERNIITKNVHIT